MNLNHKYATYGHGPRIIALQLPSGCWAVKVRPDGGGWRAFAVPRNGTVADPFDLATGDDRAEVERVAREWAASAQTLGMYYNRVVYAGTGDALNETPLVEASPNP